jgi:hypothetical protein
MSVGDGASTPPVAAVLAAVDSVYRPNHTAVPAADAAAATEFVTVP